MELVSLFFLKFLMGMVDSDVRFLIKLELNQRLGNKKISHAPRTNVEVAGCVSHSNKFCAGRENLFTAKSQYASPTPTPRQN